MMAGTVVAGMVAVGGIIMAVAGVSDPRSASVLALAYSERR
jgi:hypothetical protein